MCSNRIRHSAAALLEQETQHSKGDLVIAMQPLSGDRLQVFGYVSEYLHVYCSPIMLREALALYVTPQVTRKIVYA